jgi:cytochrome c oxidase cbb3-type subunit 3
MTLFAVSVAAGATTMTGCDTTGERAPLRARSQTRISGDHVAVTAERIQDGAELFARNCVKCHGEDAGGRVGVGPSLKSETFLAAASDKMLLATIADGREGTTMTPWKLTLDTSAREALVAYIRSLTPHTPVKLDESPIRGDAEAGKPIFDGICARCHGRSGAGYVELSSGTGIGRRGFLSNASDGFLRYMIVHGKSQTQMRGFDGDGAAVVANLDDQQVEDVIAYLRAHAW